MQLHYITFTLKRFGDEVSKFRTILASIIQVLDLGPAYYIATESNLHPVTPEN